MRSKIFGLQGSTAALNTRYAILSGDMTQLAAWVGTEAQAEAIVSTGGSIKNLVVECVAPGVATSLVFTLRLNGADTALTVTVSGTDTTGTDTSNSVTVVAGDRVDWKCVSTAIAAKTCKLTCEFDGSTAKESILLGSLVDGNQLSNSATRYLPISGTCNSTTGTSDVLSRQLIATAGTIKNLYIYLPTAAPGVGNNYVFTLYKNGSPTALTVTVADAAQTGNDTSNDVSVSPGDLFSLQSVPNSTPATSLVGWGFTFEATTDNNFPIVAGTSSDQSTSATRYTCIVANGTSAWTATEISNDAVACGTVFTVDAMYAAVSTAPGAAASGKSWTFTLRDTSVSTNVAVTISETATTGNDTGSATFADFDDITLMCVPANTPNASVETYFGFNAYVVAPDTFIPRLFFS